MEKEKDLLAMYLEQKKRADELEILLTEKDGGISDVRAMLDAYRCAIDKLTGK